MSGKISSRAPSFRTSSSPPSARSGRKAPVEPGCLYLVGTPIGNLEDISFRAVRVLTEVDLIAAEDTRRARILLTHYQINTPVTSFFTGNEAARTAELLQHLQQARRIALISEAGMPGISDPGFRLIEQCLAAQIPVDVIPGPSATLTALLLSGLPTAIFSNFGFLERSGRARRQQLELIQQAAGTIILFEAPPRVHRTLMELAAMLGHRPAALVREMTKIHQEIVHGTLDELAQRYEEAPPRGEITLVIGGGVDEKGKPRAGQGGEEAQQLLEGEVSSRLTAGESPRQIAAALAQHGKRKVYQLALKLAASR